MAIKIEILKKNESDTINEINALNRLKGIAQIPVYFFHKKIKNKNIIAESLFGPSLKKFYLFNENLFEPILISIIGIQLIDILRNIHSKGLIHNDLKPHNICWGKFENSKYIDTNKFFLIDFGFSRKIFANRIDVNKKKTKSELLSKHYENKQENAFAGSCKYMAISITEGFRPSRRTDIEEFMYTILFLLKKGLPMENIKAKNHVERCIKMGIMKKNMDLEEMFVGVPQEFLYIYKNALKLDFSEEPDYDLYLILFNHVLQRFGISGITKQKNFVIEKINDIFRCACNLDSKKNNKISIDVLFDGYPLNNVFDGIKENKNA